MVFFENDQPNIKKFDIKFYEHWVSAVGQGEIVVARFPNWPPDELDEDHSLYGVLLFGDGSQKMLAAMTAWICLLLTWRGHGPEALKNQYVNSMIASFLSITTTIRATEAHATPLEGIIQRIVAQNIAAKVQPITSFAWASILKSFAAPSLDDALQAYNNHPEVVAHDDQGGPGISLDARKKQGVRNFLERTSSEAFAQVLASTHDFPYALGPFGEAFATNNLCFVGSKGSLEPLFDEGQGPGPNETFVEAACPSLFDPICFIPCLCSSYCIRLKL